MSNKVTCLQCGHEFPLERIYNDDKGRFTVCPKCEGSFDTNEEVELNSEQIERIDEIDNSVYEMCKVFTGDDSFEWDMSIIGEIADYAANTLVLAGYSVRYPGVIIGTDGSQHIEEYHGGEGK